MTNPPGPEDFVPVTDESIDLLMAGMRERLNLMRDTYGHMLLDMKNDRVAYCALVRVLYDTFREAAQVDPELAEQTQCAMLAFALRRIFYRHQPISTYN